MKDIELKENFKNSVYGQSKDIEEQAASVENEIFEVEDTEVVRGLKQRHITMLALGGTIGTGLFIGIGHPLQIAGPVNALIAYLFMGSIAFSVTQSLGEMATFIPVTSSFTVFTTRFVSPAFGVAVGYLYWFSWVMTFAVELSVVGQIIQFWTDAVPIAAWIGIFWVILFSSNTVPVKFYGEVEFWIACVKVIAIIGFIIYSFIMVVGGGPQGPIGFRYWRNPGAWGPGYLFPGTAKGKFLGWFSSLINAAFTYQGTELTGVSAGEAKNPRKAVPKAIKTVFLRIIFFYILSLFFIGLLVPFNDPALSSDASYAASSPFIIAIRNNNTKILPHIFNAVILVTIISAGNSNVYYSSRILYSLSKNNLSFKIFSKTTKHGVPIFSVLFSAMFGFLSFMVVSDGANTVFNWLLNITAIAGMFAWLFISISHIRFMKTLKSRGMSRNELPFKAALMPGLAYYGVIAMVIIIFFNGYDAFVGQEGDDGPEYGFNVSSFFTAYISVILFVVIWIGFQLWFRTRLFLKVDDIDIDSDRREIDAIIWEEDEPPKTWYGKVWNFLN